MGAALEKAKRQKKKKNPQYLGICYLIWYKGLCDAIKLRILRWEIILDYPELVQCNHRGP